MSPKSARLTMVNFIRIRGIHHLLTDEATVSLVLSLCVSHLGYCNSVLYGLPGHHHKQSAENPKHVCMLSTKKIKMG